MRNELRAAESAKLPALDGVRAIAVGLVILYHFGFERVPGGHGVLVFFVLSGFLITLLLLREHERSGTVSLRAFYLRRALRILPAFYGFLAVALLLLVVSRRPIQWEHVAASVGYVANYYKALTGDASRNAILNHLWSLAIEEQFYLVWPVLFIALRRRPARLLAALGGLIGAVWLTRTALELRGVGVEYVYDAFETRADALLIGCATAVLTRHVRGRELLAAASSRPWMPVPVVLIFTASALVSSQSSLYSHTVGWALEAVLAALFLVQVIELARTAPWRWLDSAPLRWTGRLSYSLYLYQQIGVSPRILPGHPMPLRLLACLALTFALAAASYYLVERPFLRLRDGHPWGPAKHGTLWYTREVTR